LRRGALASLLFLKKIMAIRWNGSNQYGAALGYKGVTGSSKRSVAQWVRVETAANLDCFFGWGTEVTGKRFYGQIESAAGNTFSISVFSGFRVWNAGSLLNGNWHHLCFVLDGTNVDDMIAYIDGSPASISSTLSKEIDTGLNDVRVARAYLWNYFDGDMFDFRIYSRALSSGEVSILYSKRGCDSVSTSLEARWKFDKESGVCASEIDLSGNGRTLTTYNSPNYVADEFDPCGGFRMLGGGLKSPMLDGAMI